MPHVALVPLTGLRVREAALLELGMSLPGLSRRGAAIEQLPALGLLTLAALTPPEWSLSYHESDAQREGLFESILDSQPDLVAISALTASATEAYSLSDRLRTAGIRTVLGGLHATTCAGEAVRHFDAVAIGDGEVLWQPLLADCRAGNLRRFYRPGPLASLAEAPLPRFDLLGPLPRPRWTLQTQRGCPLACDFCAASRMLGPFREKPLERISRELAAIRQVDPRPWIELADDNTFAGHRDVAGLCETLAAAGVRYFTESDWRIGERPEVLAYLARSGCVQVLVGIESLVFRYPGMGAKRAELDRVMDAVRAIQQAGVPVNGCFIVGGDGETQQSLDRLAEFLLECPLAEIQLTLQTPFPGTALRRRLAGAGRLLADRDWSHYTLFDVTYEPDRMSVEQLESGFRQLVTKVFASAPGNRRARIRREILRSGRSSRGPALAAKCTSTDRNGDLTNTGQERIR